MKMENNKIPFEPVPGVIRVSLAHHGFGNFTVLIVPDPETQLRKYYLTHDKSGVVLFMFGAGQIETDKYSVDVAYWNGPEYIPDFIKQHFTEEA